MKKKKAPKARAVFVPTLKGGHYIIQVQGRFLFFKWWETIKRGDNGLWNYGDAEFTKKEVDKFFEDWKEFWDNGGKFKTYREV